MILLGIVFIILFAVSVAAVAVTSAQQQTLAAKAWNASSPKTQKEIQTLFKCCGFKMNDTSSDRTSCLHLKVSKKLTFYLLISVTVYKLLVLCFDSRTDR